MIWLGAINIVSILFAATTIWLMARYLCKYKLPHSHYKRLWGFVRIKYILTVYALSTLGLTALTMSLFFIFFM